MGRLYNHHHFISIHAKLYLSLHSQMKAVAGLKMSYQVQQAINGSKGAVIRGFRHDDSDAALCSHLYTLVRGNRQHRRAFLISLLNLFDDSSVSSPFSFSVCRCVVVCVSPTSHYPSFNAGHEVLHVVPCRKPR